MRKIALFVGICWILAPVFAAGQDRGSVLVATEQVGDAGFAETVVLLLHLGDDGAIGVAVNRPTWVSTRELFPDLEFLHRYRGHAFHGGPLAQPTVLVLRRTLSPGPADSSPLVDDVYMSSDLDLLADEIDELRDDSVLRFYAGHASWRPGQLEEEIAAGAWRVIPASAAIVFDPEPVSLWRRLAVDEAQMSVFRNPATHPQPREGLLSVR